MGSFFKRSAKARSAAGPVQVLIDELDALDQDRQDGVAVQLAMLWDAFANEFGISGFLELPSSGQEAYLGRLDRIVARGPELKDSDMARYYYSAAILRHFLESRRARDGSPWAKTLSEVLVGWTERGRELQKARSSAEPARSWAPSRSTPVLVQNRS
jgi:hypothetical protein